MKQQFKFCPKRFDINDGSNWSRWHDLPDNKLFDTDCHYDFRSTPKPLVDGLYADPDDLSKVPYRKLNGLWYDHTTYWRDVAGLVDDFTVEDCGYKLMTADVQ